jgi:hypothetical protein
MESSFPQWNWGLADAGPGAGTGFDGGAPENLESGAGRKTGRKRGRKKDLPKNGQSVMLCRLSDNLTFWIMVNLQMNLVQ